MTTSVLAAGDHFVLTRLLVDALHEEVPDGLQVSELTLPWPVEPFGRVAEVDEASGTEEQMVQALAGAQVCVTQMAPLTRAVLEASPDLELFCVGRGGPVNADLEAAAEHGVAVCNAPGRNATATAEHTLGMVLAAVRRIPQSHTELTAGQWRGDHYRYEAVGPELEGSTVGLVGYGAIGARVARLLAAFGAHVLYTDPYTDPGAADGAEQVPLAELLSRSRVVTLHARATSETKGMIGRAELESMPAGSVLVNCARGSLVDHDALCDALDGGHLWGAALDVFPEEPVPEGSRLLRTPHLTVTPHLAGASRQTAANAARTNAAEVGRWLRGEPLQHCVNAADGQPPVRGGRPGG